MIKVMFILFRRKKGNERKRFTFSPLIIEKKLKNVMQIQSKEESNKLYL